METVYHHTVKIRIMKNHILPIILLMMLTFTAEGQSFWDDVTISAQYAAAHHDKRVFFSKERLLREQPEKWGTWQYGVSIQKQVFGAKTFLGKLGIGYSQEHFTFEKLVNHCFFNTDGSCPDILAFSDDYRIHLLSLPLSMSFIVISGLSFDLNILPQFDVYKELNNKKGIGGFHFYSVEINPGINYEWRKFQVGFYYRIWQLKKIDRVYYSNITLPRDYDLVKRSTSITIR